MLATYDPGKKEYQLNSAIEKITGWTNEYVKKMSFFDLVYHDSKYRKEVEAFFEAVTPGFRDFNTTGKDGTVIQTSWANIKLPDGRIVGIGIDVTEQKKLERQLQLRAHELSIANKELESFSYSVSHDLQAPVCSINAFSNYLLNDHYDKLDEDAKMLIERIIASGKKMSELIECMLNLAIVLRQEMHIGDIDLSRIARSVAAELTESEPKRQVKIKIHDGINVKGDYQLLKIVLSNLIGNAWKYTSKTPDPSIEIGIVKVDNCDVCFVKDNRAGFNMRYKDRLFVPFQRLHSDKEFSGTGIGLATVQRIIYRHGGTVWGEAAPGKGATFYYTIGKQMIQQMNEAQYRDYC